MSYSLKPPVQEKISKTIKFFVEWLHELMLLLVVSHLTFIILVHPLPPHVHHECTE